MKIHEICQLSAGTKKISLVGTIRPVTPTGARRYDYEFGSLNEHRKAAAQMLQCTVDELLREN